MDELHLKKEKLYDYLKSLGSLAVAFSGGVDSSFLLKCAHDVLSDNVIAITARSSTFPKRELNEAIEFAKEYGIRQIIIDSDELDIKGFRENPVDRCYYCKSELFAKIKKVAEENNIKYIAEGSNMDDLGDYRPGLKAARECGAISPLRTAGLTKNDIRALSKEMGLKTWDKPSFACLASRIPYGQTITKEKLLLIDKAEQFLIDLGFKQIRVRHHGEIARIELLPEDMIKIFQDGLREKIHDYFKSLGFTYITLDLNGYKTGSMNATLDKKIIDNAKIK
ncbi:putative protein slr1717 [[Clostridium] cellulosi]|uniref:NAD/GMP synthase domain-containing protein n=1 Tax=[Clostridium] cellulosi TaxID=29343 RepID=A0A078KP81_9FIRM|nr:MAG: ATP-dependent sacrificial sulfur transferase LarE [[Clostridium] cellulosi]CDZ24273.1 putative protein slr1717 [[Clostridium] cellulosi]